MNKIKCISVWNLGQLKEKDQRTRANTHGSKPEVGRFTNFMHIQQALEGVGSQNQIKSIF